MSFLVGHSLIFPKAARTQLHIAQWAETGKHSGYFDFVYTIYLCVTYYTLHYNGNVHYMRWFHTCVCRQFICIIAFYVIYYPFSIRSRYCASCGKLSWWWADWHRWLKPVAVFISMLNTFKRLLRKKFTGWRSPVD